MLNRIHKTSLKYRRVVHNNYRKFVMLVLVSTIPTGLIGIIGKGLVSAAGQTLLTPRDLSSDDRRCNLPAAHCGYDQGRT